jgi:RNA polymerase sigma factor (sigma-70 family)
MKIVIKDIDQTKLANNNIFASTNEMLSLQEYVDISKRCIGHFASSDLAKQMLQSEDAISFVAEHLMMATCRHDAAKGRTLRSYHNQCAIWAIQNWVARISKNTDYEILSLNKELKDGGTAREMYQIIEDDRPAPISDMERQENMDRVKKLLASPVLSQLEQSCISMKFLSEMSANEISKSLDINRKLVYTSIQKGLAKLREFHDED